MLFSNPIINLLKEKEIPRKKFPCLNTLRQKLQRGLHRVNSMSVDKNRSQIYKSSLKFDTDVIVRPFVMRGKVPRD